MTVKKEQWVSKLLHEHTQLDYLNGKNVFKWKKCDKNVWGNNLQLPFCTMEIMPLEKSPKKALVQTLDVIISQMINIQLSIFGTIIRNKLRILTKVKTFGPYPCEYIEAKNCSSKFQASKTHESLGVKYLFG